MNKIYSFHGQVPMVLVGNNYDLQQSPNEIEKLAHEIQILKLAYSLGIPYIETNAMTGQNVDEAFHVNNY